MRIASGVTDQYVYFVAVDATDFTTRETGLSSFTVYRSRNGGAAAPMTAPTINETSLANMPGVYELLLDEDMTIDAGDDTQEMAFHITHAGMAPVTRSIELYRPKVTAGNTLGVASTGDISGNVDGNVDGNVGGNVTGSVASVTGAVGSVTGAVGSVTGAVASVTGAVGSVAGNVDGNVTGSVGSLATQAKADVNAEVVDTLATDTYAELADVPAATVSLSTKLGWLYMLARNKVTQDATTQTLRNDADSASIGTSTVSDSAGTFTRGEWTDSP